MMGVDEDLILLEGATDPGVKDGRSSAVVPTGQICLGGCEAVGRRMDGPATLLYC